MPYFSKRALQGLKEYTYKPGGYSILDKLHQPFWNYITDHLLPPWLAPNLITLMGLSALVAAYATAAVYLPDFAGLAPRWVYFATGSACLFYLHMDCLDGKQARKTQNSSPLGQLFDHGCDALAVHLILAGLIVSFNLSVDWKATVGCLYVMVPWILAHWEEYHTGVMVYGNGLWGVTEANYAVVILHFVTCAMGPQRWHLQPFARLAAWQPVQGLLPAAALKPLAAMQLNEVVIVVIGVMALFLAAEQLLRVFRLAGSPLVARTTLPAAEQGHKQLGKAAAASHLAQLGVMFVLGVGLMALPEADVGPVRVVMGTYGLTYALQATRLIMSHMAKEPFEAAAWPLAAMALQLGNAWLRLADPSRLAVAVCVVVLLGYLHYVISMINQICAFLGIPCLTVRKVAD